MESSRNAIEASSPATSPLEKETTPATSPPEKVTTPATSPPEKGTTPATSPPENETTPATSPSEKETTPVTFPPEKVTTSSTSPLEKVTTPATATSPPEKVTTPATATSPPAKETTPATSPPAKETTPATSPSEKVTTSEKKSPVSEFLNRLSPIMPSRARASLRNQRLSEFSFTSISSLVNSPPLNAHQRPICLSFVERDEIGGSSSNGHNQDDSMIKNGKYWAPHGETHGACFNTSEVTTEKTKDNANDGVVEISGDERWRRMLDFSNGHNQGDSMIKNGEYWAPHDETRGACFNASEVTTEKTKDNANDGVVEISGDERWCRMLDFSSKNIPEHVESDEFLEHVSQGFDSQPTFLGGNQLGESVIMLIVITREVVYQKKWRILRKCPFFTCLEVNNLLTGLTNNPNPKLAQKGRGKNKETFPVKIQAWKHCNCIRSRCVKLYCECFAAGIYCDNCACQNCLNNPDYDDTVLDTRQQIELRNPLAFASPVVFPSNDSPNVTAEVGCSAICNCEDCDNSFGKKPVPLPPLPSLVLNPMLTPDH
ncbi:Protein lin-54 [Gossypium arboreum]|uniref:Protein lin-54 n=1 Tax=Gossypium arboreum TaxID=29729 RepID=A0A0B0MJ60_GOSAR|nr:Protein lin-54 [Gossypium arboreum]KHG27409.1 Protein lin-54 [Gossypium arboreum]